jgi:CheY-like chemotaxis protein
MTPSHAPLVLVVDDDINVRKVLKQILERSGFSVLLAEHGVHALAVLDQAREPVRVLLTDVVMPSMGGVELAERVLARPSPPHILLMSGFPHQDASLVVAGERPPFFQKPLDMKGLVRRIEQLLGVQG